ncbi:DUF1211 domain-containing protein [Nakamurella flavida]|uniref:DUF1211 domain-containing protein n=1 Tax=Nakamurella flavida TaxID=363630 RepID=A0A939C3M4_9ACTN|nr:TMEM175 family protein [Nakamurella flavida]MBM9477825.1 DUF1211 domain-containing protein [Nakamurella flavida]MDP9779379.1 putative membrane protein [Nakamurella flavida]
MRLRPVLRENDEGGDTDRIGALSDGVVAIALTVLALTLTVPTVGGSPQQLWAALVLNGREYVTFLFSFWLIAQLWMVHRRVLPHFSAIPAAVAWWNFLYLGAIVVLPSTANLLTDNSDNPVAVTLFAANLVLSSLGLQMMSVAARRAGVLTGFDDESWARNRVRALTILAVPLLVIAVSWFDASTAEWLFALMFFQEVPAALISRARSRRS